MHPMLEKLTEVAKAENLPTYTICVADKDSIETSVINLGNPCQNSYSVAKLFCVTAVGMLVDEGKLSTEATIAELFAEELDAYGIPREKWANVTLSHVMLHKVGFEHGFLDIDKEDITQYETDDFLKKTLSHPLVYAPGEVYVYSDAAYYLVSRVITKISGEKLDDFLMKRLFSLIDIREVAFSKCPYGYPVGATGLYIRSYDMVKLGRIYLDGGRYGDHQIISQNWIDTVLKMGYELKPQGRGYAKGGMLGQKLYINFDEDIAIAWHSYDKQGATKAIGALL